MCAAARCKDQSGDCLKAAESFCSHTVKVPQDGTLIPRPLPFLGLNNQRESLLNAAIAALLQNATLVTPKAYLVSHASQEPKPHTYDGVWKGYTRRWNGQQHKWIHGKTDGTLANVAVPFSVLFDDAAWHTTLASHGLNVVDSAGSASVHSGVTIATSYEFSTCVRYFDCCKRVPYCMEMQKSLVKPSQPIVDKVKVLQKAVRKPKG